ncbi:MAG: response regulator [Alphaproteobacteria bacterium]|nr:response regulator [Alphaproteobacteria bacterium]
MSAPLHILIVDDEPLAVAVIGDFLARKGHRITVAHSGQEALESHAHDPADLVITDIRMPGGDGHMLIAKLREADAKLPIIVVTGQIELGVAGFGQDPPVLKKPVDLRKLVAMIDRLPPAATKAAYER